MTETVNSLMQTAIAAVVNTGSAASDTLAPQGVCGVYYDGSCYVSGAAFDGFDTPTGSTAFGLASVTKTFSTAVIGQLGSGVLGE